MQNIRYILLQIFILIKISGVINYELYCADGNQIIHDELICDGYTDCNDNSDESVQICMHGECEGFRCANGGCITDINKLCDNHPDCSDNSDETEGQCAKKLNDPELKAKLNNKSQGTCRPRFFQCKQNLSCIKMIDVCNGIADCGDGSDETAELCAHRKCRSYAFRCAYGGCIAGTSKCNSKQDCVDGSDETDFLCKRNPLPIRYKKLPPNPTQLLQSTQPPQSTPLPQSTQPPHQTRTTGCQIPKDRKNLIIFNDNQNKRQNTGDIVSDSNVLLFSCPPNYFLIGEKKTFCNQIKWNDEIPRCIKYCNATEITHGVSTQVFCKNGTMAVECEDIQPGFVAEIACANQFLMQEISKPPWHSILTCREDSKWDNRKGRCTMICGQAAKEVTEFALGVAVNITEVPWQVGIYGNFDNKGYVRQCAGTIITPYLVVTAAHCFWDPANYTFYDKSLYSLAAGKSYSDYNYAEIFVQKSSIRQIIGNNYNYNDLFNDIALVVLDKPLRFTKAVRPACRQFSIRTNDTGYVAGWSTNGAGVLQQVEMTILLPDDCSEYLKDNNISTNPLTNKTFCGLVLVENETVCKGDSGGGFYIKIADNNGVQHHRLVGVVSNSPRKNLICSTDGIVVFTDLRYFDDWITYHYWKYYERNEDDSTTYMWS